MLLAGQPVAPVRGRADAVSSCLSRPCLVPPLGCAGAGVTSAGTGRHKHPRYRSGCIFAAEDKCVAGLGWAQSKPQLCWSSQIARQRHPNYQHTQQRGGSFLTPSRAAGASPAAVCPAPMSGTAAQPARLLQHWSHLHLLRLLQKSQL